MAEPAPSSVALPQTQATRPSSAHETAPATPDAVPVRRTRGASYLPADASTALRETCRALKRPVAAYRRRLPEQETPSCPTCHGCDRPQVSTRVENNPRRGTLY